MDDFDLARLLLRQLRGTHLTLDILKFHLDHVLGGTGEGVTSYPADMVVRISINTTTWGPVREPPTAVVSTRTLWRVLAETFGYSEEQMAVAGELWDDAEVERQVARLPQRMLDDSWYVVGLRAHCVRHCSDRCDDCPPPTGFRRSYGIWVAPHPNWPDPPRGVWRRTDRLQNPDERQRRR